MARKPKVELIDCQGERCDAQWSWLDRPDGVVGYHMASNGKRGRLHEPAKAVSVRAVTTDDYLWLFECPFCGYAESDTIEPEE